MKPVVREAFPNDDDGEVLYRLAAKGIDLNVKRQIDFSCDARDEIVAQRIVDDLASYGYQSHVFVDDGEGRSGSVSVYSAITMLPTYDLIVLEQRRLNLILKEHGTFCDGWMTESTPETKLQ